MCFDCSGSGEPNKTHQLTRAGFFWRLQYWTAALMALLFFLQILIISSAVCDNKFGATMSITSETSTKITTPPHPPPHTPIISTTTTTTTSTTTITTPAATTIIPYSSKESAVENNQVFTTDISLRDGHCNDETEFSCQSDNNRCIPIEWRCDFTEQCSDGEDELGCLPEWCNFDHGLCNWRSHIELKDSGREFWRRYVDVSRSNFIALKTSSSTSPRRTPHNNNATDKPHSDVGLLRGELGKLIERLDQHAKFIYVPMIVDTNQNIMNGSKEGYRIKMAHLRAPLISQTNSMCQLRFKYSMWIASQVDSHLKGQLTLSLLARPHHRGASRAEQSARSSIIWSKTIDQSIQSGIDWSIGLVELGHLKEIELEFEVKFASSAFTSKVAETKLKGEINNPTITLLAPDEHFQQQLRQKRQLPTQSSAMSSLVALNWLKFQGCAWPLGSYQDLLINNYQLNPTSKFSNRKLPIQWQNDDEKVASCDMHQFQCSNDICLDEAKLCNFVDDCMHDVDELGGSGGPSEIQRGLDSGSFGEDELEILCEPVPGRVNFETPDLGIRGLPMLGVPLRSTFWTLNSLGWPQDKIRVRNNLNQASHLPAQDHTFRNVRGHYLSLEMPQLVVQSRQQQIFSGSSGGSGGASSDAEEATMKNNLWIYLSSPWMKKLDTGIGGDDCRVKFFYNLVTDTTQTANRSPEDYLPYRIYLIIEHFVLEHEAERPSQIVGLSRRMDSFIFSQLLNRDNLIPADRARSIEYPGLDFWREVNYKLGDLQLNDIFYIRIAVIVEIDETTPKLSNQTQRITFNIDDLSTHFGCSQITDQTMLNLTRKQYFDDSLHLNNYLKSARISTTHDFMPRKRRQPESLSVQFEAHKLIMCVMGALFSVFGAILLIVYVVVPYVERFAMNYHDRLAAGLSDLESSTNRDDLGSCELTTEADWEQLSRLWQRSTLCSSAERVMTNAAVTTLNS